MGDRARARRVICSRDQRRRYKWTTGGGGTGRQGTGHSHGGWSEDRARQWRLGYCSRQGSLGGGGGGGGENEMKMNGPPPPSPLYKLVGQLKSPETQEPR